MRCIFWAKSNVQNQKSKKKINWTFSLCGRDVFVKKKLEIHVKFGNQFLNNCPGEILGQKNCGMNRLWKSRTLVIIHTNYRSLSLSLRRWMMK